MCNKPNHILRINDIEYTQLSESSLIKGFGVIPGFYAKPSTHHMHDPGSIVPHIWPKVLIDNQLS
jgi:hypothetical protein